MRDVDVRRALKGALIAEHASDDSTLIIDELGICNGQKRVDVAVVNGELAGYEIKSDRDTLDRLSNQRDVYNEVFDRVTLVAGERHLDRALEVIPTWWGIIAAVVQQDRIVLRNVRDASQNPEQNPESVARLLWRDEALHLLEAHGLSSPTLRRGSRRRMWAELAQALPLPVLAQAVRETLRTRAGWRDRSARPASGDAKS